MQSSSTNWPPTATEVLITSAQNPQVKRLRKLVRNRRYRSSEGVFLVEGIAQVRQAIDHGAEIETLVVAPDLLTSEGAWDAIGQQQAVGTAVTELGRAAFESIVDRDHPSGLLATVRMWERPVTDLTIESDGIAAALLDVGNPGNLGSIIRTVDAMGGAGVVIVGESTDEFHPAAVKASMGTIFSVPIFHAAGPDDLFAWALMERCAVVTTSARAEADFWDAPLSAPLMFFFGSETRGLPDEVRARSDLDVVIPMLGSASSLNLAVSAGILLYEARRRVGGR